MVTAAAALDSGAYTPTSPFNDPGYCTEYGQHVSNAGNPDQTGPEAFGNVTLAQGFEHSINSVFCNVGKQIGGEEILKYAKRFGFYSLPPLELPPAESRASGLYKNNKLWFPKSNTQIDSGRLAFGQFYMLATPLQMAMVGAGDRERRGGGTALSRRPHRRARRQPREKTAPHMLGRPIKPRTAAELNQMMQLVVQGGTAATRRVPAEPQGRRQDRHRRDRDSGRLRRMVRVLRPCEQAALRRRRPGREAAERLRRLGIGPDRQGRPRKAAGTVTMILIRGAETSGP